MTAKRIAFELKAEGGMSAGRELMSRFMPNGQWVLNRTSWRGKEPRSCAVTRLKSRDHRVDDPSPVTVDVEVTYRPKGHISYVGGTRYDGWSAMLLDRTNEGVLLDGNGQPLEDGKPPVYLRKEVYQEIEFSDLEFGDFVSEVDIEDVKETTAEAVHKELMASGTFNASLRGAFIAAHRARPLKKIILSNDEPGWRVDGFGTHLLFINPSGSHFEYVFMEELRNLMCEFIEGKASIENTGNDDVAFVQLSKALVDCDLADGETWFDMLYAYTPADFLEDLARRLMAVYAITVSVVKGKEGGLVLRHEATAK